MFLDKRRKDNKPDLVYLNQHKRAEHIVRTTKDMDYFLRHDIREADRVKKGEHYFMVLDVEFSNTDKYFWHERDLRVKGVGENKVEERKRYFVQPRAAQIIGGIDWKNKGMVSLKVLSARYSWPP